jgi:hypothetical protein
MVMPPRTAEGHISHDADRSASTRVRRAAASWERLRPLARTEQEADAAEACFNADVGSAIQDRTQKIVAGNALYSRLDPQHPGQSDFRRELSSSHT